MNRFQQQRRALGSDAFITLICDSTATAEQQFHELWRITDEFEQRASRFLATSELTHINQQAGTRTTCSREMQALLAAAKTWGEWTQGIFNPFILPRLVEAGYEASWTTHVVAPALPAAVRVPAIAEFEIGEDWVLIPKDCALDLGGIGKGYLLDQLVQQIDSSVTDYWLSFGGDIVGRGTDLEQVPWTIEIADAADDTRSIAAVTLPSKGNWTVTTSGTNRRRGSHNGKDWHHLINPVSGQPAKTDILTATLVAQSAVAADVLASCAVIVGRVEAKQLLAEQGVTEYLLQMTDGAAVVAGQLIQRRKGIA